MELQARRCLCDVALSARKIYGNFIFNCLFIVSNSNFSTVPNMPIDVSISPGSSLCTITPPLSPSSCSLTSTIGTDMSVDMKKDNVLEPPDSGIPLSAKTMFKFLR